MRNECPKTIEDVRQIILQAGEAGTPIALSGHNSKAGIGRPVRADTLLSLAGLDQIIDYHASELTLTAGMGLGLDVLQAALAEHNQYLPFEPFDYGPLLGFSAGKGTLGGLIGCGFSGSRRVAVGAIRDFVHGYRGVSGRGEIHKAGGPVFKTVTGYDLARLMVGAFGTLAAVCEVSLKVLPRPDTSMSWLVPVNDDWTGVKLMTAALGTPCGVSGAAMLPQGVGLPAAFDYQPQSPNGLVVFRLEGVAEGVAERSALLGQALDLEALGGFSFENDRSERLWRWFNQGGPMLDALKSDPDALIWRVSCPASDGAYVGAALMALEASHYYDWGGGLIHAAVPADVSGETVRASFSAYGGHATLIKAREDVRLSVAPFQPLFPAEAAISQRIKQVFDPLNILNPWRMSEPVQVK